MALYEKKYLTAFEKLAELTLQKKKLEAEDAKIREQIEKSMDEFNIRSIDNDFIMITRVAANPGKASLDLEALKKAEISPKEIGYINAHGTSTPKGDVIENQAIKNVFGEHAYHMKVTSTKGATGHMMGGGGVTEAITCLMTIREGVIPPTLNLENPGEEFDLDYVPQKAVADSISYAMTNAFGFGGQNSSILLGEYHS